MLPSSEPDPCAGDSRCRDALAVLYSYLDGELTVDRRERIHAHLETCSPCGERYTFEAELRQVVSMRCRQEVPESLRARIAAALEREGGRPH